MPSDPAQPPSPKRPQSAGADDRPSPAPGEQQSVELAVEERSGPLTITRVVKDDGRSLILYGHAESQAELAEAGREDSAAREAERADATAREAEGRDGPA
jgi:hypothetical protein